jgi:hypothetical protein
MSDSWFSGLVASRTARAIVLFGDSISRGYALGGFADVPELATHPLYEFRSIASMGNPALRENGRPEVIAYAGNAVREPSAPARVQSLISDGVIRRGDVVFIEDAGDYARFSPQYRDELIALRRAVVEREAVTCVLMTMFDYSSDPAFQFDTKDAAGMTRNDAIRAAAAADIPHVGDTILLDMNAKMDEWRTSALGQDGVDVIHADGIHPNVWGQMFMTGEILKAAGVGYLATINSAASLAQANWDVLRYGSPYWTGPTRAGQFADHCLRR